MEEIKVELKCRIDTQDEVDYFNHDGILPFVLKQLAGGIKFSDLAKISNLTQVN